MPKLLGVPQDGSLVIADDWRSRARKRDGLQQGDEWPDGTGHPWRVGRRGHGERVGFRTIDDGLRRRGTQRAHGTSDDHVVRTQPDGDRKSVPTAKMRDQGWRRVRQREQTGRCAGRTFVHELSALVGDGDGVGGTEYASSVEGRELSDAVARDDGWLGHRGRERPPRRHADAGQERLCDGVALRPRHVEQLLSPTLSKGVDQRLADPGGRAVEPGQHLRMLRALTGKEQRQAQLQIRTTQEAAARASAAPPGDSRRSTNERWIRSARTMASGA